MMYVYKFAFLVPVIYKIKHKKQFVWQKVC
jgi:hypothetical protein